MKIRKPFNYIIQVACLLTYFILLYFIISYTVSSWRHSSSGDSNIFSEYVQNIKNKGYSIFITIYPSDSKIMSEDIKMGLRELGLKTNFLYNFLLGYYAVIDEENIIECLSEDITLNGVKFSGSLKNNKRITYSIISNNFNLSSDCSASIVIGGTLYSKNMTGLNIVVYNNKLDMVVSSRIF